MYCRLASHNRKTENENDVTHSKRAMLFPFELVFEQGNRIANVVRHLVKKIQEQCFFFFNLSLTWETLC